MTQGQTSTSCRVRDVRVADATALVEAMVVGGRLVQVLADRVWRQIAFGILENARVVNETHGEIAFADVNVVPVCEIVLEREREVFSSVVRLVRLDIGSGSRVGSVHDRRDATQGIEQIQDRVAFELEHTIDRERVVLGSMVREFLILDGAHCDPMNAIIKRCYC